MKHIEEDRLLEYALETRPDDEDRKTIEAHLAECQQCRDALEKIRDELTIIGSIRPDVTPFPVQSSNKRKSIVPALLKAAALVIFGAVTGFGLAAQISTEQVSILPRYEIQSSSNSSLQERASREATRVDFSLYKQWLK